MTAWSVSRQVQTYATTDGTGFRVQQCGQDGGHHYSGRLQHCHEQSRHRRDCTIPTTARRPFDPVHLLSHDLRSRQRMHGDAHQCHVVWECHRFGRKHTEAAPILLAPIHSRLSAQHVLGDSIQDGRHHETAAMRADALPEAVLRHNISDVDLRCRYDFRGQSFRRNMESCAVCYDELHLPANSAPNGIRIDTRHRSASCRYSVRLGENIRRYREDAPSHQDAG